MKLEEQIEKIKVEIETLDYRQDGLAFQKYTFQNRELLQCLKPAVELNKVIEELGRINNLMNIHAQPSLSRFDESSWHELKWSQLKQQSLIALQNLQKELKLLNDAEG